MRVDRKTESDLRSDFVSFGYGDVAHVVAEPYELRPLPVVPCRGRTSPGRDFLLRGFLPPEADDNFSTNTHPGQDEAVFAVPVCSLIHVHEVHVNRVPRKIAIELRMQMADRLLELF